MRSSQYTQFNCYEVLNVSFAAGPDQIKHAWKQACLKHHPDRGGTHERQARINAAYDILKDPIAKQAHDTYWKVDRHSHHSKNGSEEQGNAKTQKESTRKKKPETQSTTGEPLFAFKDRIYQGINEKKSKIWQDLDRRTSQFEDDFSKRFSLARQNIAYTFLGGIICSFISVHLPILWLAVVGLGWSCISNLRGIEVSRKKFSPFDPLIGDKLKAHAHFKAAESCNNEVKALDLYTSILASFTELVVRSSSYDDSEEQVARRLTVSMFLMGYKPAFYNSEDRTILFRDGEEKILVRFRHRVGTATNITYVKTFVALMKAHNTSNGLLFCSPGLSGSAKEYAHKNSVKSYSLESMNTWINEILTSTYDGPLGDPLANMDELKKFLSQISPKLIYSRRGRYRGRRYR